MTERELADRKAREFFEGLWQQEDFWDFESSAYEQARCAQLLAMLEGRRYARALEIGCGAGHFTSRLAHIANWIVALDVAPTAIARARTRGIGPATVDFRVANIMEYNLHDDGPWDLIVVTETICYLGWLYPFFNVAWLASELFATTREGGWLLLANSMYEDGDPLLLPWLTRTYRDLFRNVGYQLEAEEIFRGTKHEVEFEVLSSLFQKGATTGVREGTINSSR